MVTLHSDEEMGAMSLWGKTLRDDGQELFGGFQQCLKGVRNIPIIACLQMTFYQVNDCFVLRRKAVTARLAEEGVYPLQVSTKLAAYGVKANSDGIRVLNFQ